nr:DUF599 family protein [uncultured Amphritea sp.]
MYQIATFAIDNWINLIAISWFIICFKGYNIYTKKRSRNTYCLASLMYQYRLEWMTQMIGREVRIADEAAIANLERGVAFFASSTLLILASLMTINPAGKYIHDA